MTQMSSAETSSPPASTAATAQQEVARLAGMRAVHVAFEWFTAHSRELTERQMEVSRIPAPPFGEAQRAEWLRARFVELGLRDVHIDEVGNVIGIRPGTRPSDPAAGKSGEKSGLVALMAHMDTVFPAGTPIEIRREGDRLHGPGISDNGAGLTALLAIAAALDAGKIRNVAPILFVADVGEEGEGDLRGVRHIFGQPRWREAITSVIVVDGGGTESLITEGLGSRRFVITVRGPGGHSWTDFGAPNPIVILARAIDLFSRTPVPHDPKTAFNIGEISGGTSVNAIPESASMKVDLRSTSPAEIDRLEQALRDALSRAAGNLKESGYDPRHAPHVSYEMKPIGNRPAAQLSPEARIRQVFRAVDARLGIESRVQRASTDANLPLSLGMEALAVGAGGVGGGAHTLHEWYDPANRDLGLRRILLALLTLTGTE